MRDGIMMLRECRRVLKPDGHLRITTPDFEFLIWLYLHADEEHCREYIRWSIERFYQDVAFYYGKYVCGEQLSSFFGS